MPFIFEPFVPFYETDTFNEEGFLVRVLLKLRECMAEVVVQFPLKRPEIATRPEYQRLATLVHETASDHPLERMRAIGQALTALVSE